MKKWHRFSLGLILLVMAGMMSLPVAYGYEGVEVKNGGSISGKITLKGEKPSARVFALVLYPFGPFCKKISDGEGNVRLKEFIVSEDGGLWEAVVAVKAVKKGKPYRPQVADFVATDCMFHPADVADNEMFIIDEKGQLRHEHPNVSILHNHQKMNMINRDPIIHNIQVFQNEKGNIILNTPLPPAKKVKPGATPVAYKPRGGVLHYKKGKRISQMICGMHEFMQSWGFVVDNPYYAKTAKDGTFTIDGLLPGTYTVGIWHPQFKVFEQEITIEANKTTRLDFALNADLVRRPEYEKQKQFRISPATPQDHMLREGDDRIIID
ncbi:carboxypeptidase regulatory-like domain-containing protein [bacterium AH-315-L15]|nr:carboxypeptidase regulatory-like domain-containing protein [bacterium AH-315-L15]